MMDPTEKKVVIIGLIFVIFVFASLFGNAILQRFNQPEVNLLSNPYPAKDFTLRNYENESIQFNAYKGKVRLVTFVYQQCPDGCSLVATKVITAFNHYQDIGKSDQIATFIIDFDYVHDTAAELRSFAKGLTGTDEILPNRQFLYGNETEIVKVAADWNFYFAPVNETTNSTTTQNAYLNPQHQGTHKALWIHQFIVYVVDEEGLVQRLFTGTDWDNQELYDTIDYLLVN